MKAQFLTDLDVRLVDELQNHWQLLADLRYYSAYLGRELLVPAGFVTDFASVPRIPIIYDLQGGKGDKAAVVHDMLYSTQCVDRETADKVLAEALLACGYSQLTTVGWFYAGVRLFGASHWTKDNVPQNDDVQDALIAGA